MSDRPVQPFVTHISLLDLRSIAAFRVVLAIGLWFTLVDLWCAVPLWYSDGGLLPRVDAIALGGFTGHNPLLAVGDVTLLRLITLIGMVTAAALLFGYRSRSSLLISGVIVFSFSLRSPAISSAAEWTVAGLALWALLLPLSGAWSLDRALDDDRVTTGRPQDFTISGMPGIAWALQWVWIAVFLLMSSTTSSLTVAALSVLLLGWILRAWRPATSLWALAAAAALLLAITLQAAALPAADRAPWILLGGLACLALLPSAAWSLWRWRTHRAVQVYYDGQCRFCRLSCQVLHELLILPQGSTLSAAQDHARAHTLMQAHDSWVVIDAQGHAHTDWAAGVVLVRHSAWLRPLASLLSFAPMRGMGQALYRAVVRHRGRLAQLFAALPSPGRVPVAHGRTLTLLGMVLLVLQAALFISHAPAASGRAAALHAFSPLILTRTTAPDTQSQWLAVVDAAPGQFVDALRGNRTLTWTLDAPTDPFDSHRWRSFFAALTAEQQGATPRRLAQYLCQHHRPRPDTVHLALLTAGSRPGSVERSRSARFQCLPEGVRTLRASADGDPLDFP